ncbi:hypothetical protein [Adlercreutzia sp. ZJ141]|uniref:hypothetical protein n=1 Tax=Adlercreutzia sp. ZJ141 TaxID=2709406 RepID=UPI0013EDB3F2|nr:hypothetical protein [Adlercreutzia sp. ZJ141]
MTSDYTEQDLGDTVAQLASESRRERQNAAIAMSEYAQVNPQALTPFASSLVAALDCREARTRWECFKALSALAAYDPSIGDDVFPAAEDALFEEGSGFVRLSALRFLCAYGATDVERSKRAWPLIEEAIQCYHGDAEFHDMLTAVAAFASGDLDDEVKEALAARVSFDAKNGKGSLKRRTQQILDNLRA